MNVSLNLNQESSNRENRKEQSRIKINWKISPEILKARNAFRKELPELLVEHRGKWVAYKGVQRLGVGDTEIELFQQFNPNGEIDDAFFTHLIVPQ